MLHLGQMILLRPFICLPGPSLELFVKMYAIILLYMIEIENVAIKDAFHQVFN